MSTSWHFSPSEGFTAMREVPSIPCWRRGEPSFGSNIPSPTRSRPNILHIKNSSPTFMKKASRRLRSCFGKANPSGFSPKVTRSFMAPSCTCGAGLTAIFQLKSFPASPASALQAATDLVGYDRYLDRIPEIIVGQRRHASGNRVETDRARHALTLAAEGRKVAVVSGGDPGVFAMAAAVFEAIEAGDPAWRELDIHVEPGITAMLAAAAEVGAPLGADFCAISLSDNLKPWQTIERRLRAAAEGDFVIALYNPASRARPHQLGRAFDLLRASKPP